MPLHFDDVDLTSEVVGLNSALIIPCNMCAGATVAVRERKPFIRLFRSFLTPAPLAGHIAALQARLGEQGLRTEVFSSQLPHHWFLCLWTSGRRKALQKQARLHDAVIVLGCDSAVETVRDAVESTGCKVIPGMKASGIINVKPRFHLPANVSLEASKLIPVCDRHCKRPSRPSPQKERA